MMENVTSSLAFCSANATVSEFWENGEFATCVSDFVGASLSLAFILSFAVPKLWFQDNVSNKTELDGELPVSRLFQLQVGLNAAMTPLGLLKALANIFISGEVRDHVALVAVNSLVSWPVVVATLLKERRTRLSNQGHTFALRVFWIGNFVYSNVALFSLLEPKTLENGSRLVLTLGVAEYVVSGLVYWMGEKAAGLAEAPKDEASVEADVEEYSMDGIPAGWGLSDWNPRLRMLRAVIWANRKSVLKLNLVVCVVLMLVQRVLYVYEPLYESYLLNSINLMRQPRSGTSEATSETSTEGGEDMVSVAMKQVRWDYILISAGLRAAGKLVRGIKGLFWDQFKTKLSECLNFQYIRKIHYLSLRWHLNNRGEEVVYCEGTTSVCEITSSIFFSFVPTVIDVAVTIGLVATSVSFRFGLVVFFTAFAFKIREKLCARFVNLFSFGDQTRNSDRHHQNENIQTRLRQSIDNFEFMKSCTNEQFEIDRYESGTLEHMKDTMKIETKHLGKRAVSSAFGDVTRCVGMFVVAAVVTSSGLSFGDYYLLTSHFSTLRWSFHSLKESYKNLLNSFKELENLLKILEDEPEVKDVEGAQDIKLESGAIEFRNVSFGYIPGSPVLKNISFVAPGGSSLAIVGQSGSGKTTLMKLLMRFYDVTSGQILIDGQDISKVKQLSFRKNMGIVPQETVFLDDETLADNILYANTSATSKSTPEASKSIVDAATKNARIHNKIMSLPQCYDTKIGRGQVMQLSGGEKQRIGIARMFLRDPKIVLLDEATSALDTRTEQQIQTSLHQLCENRTSVTVAHRLPTVINADKILVISSEGTLAEQGTHAELLAQNGLYAEMWNARMKPMPKVSSNIAQSF